MPACIVLGNAAGVARDCAEPSGDCLVHRTGLLDLHAEAVPRGGMPEPLSGPTLSKLRSATWDGRLPFSPQSAPDAMSQPLAVDLPRTRGGRLLLSRKGWPAPTVFRDAPSLTSLLHTNAFYIQAPGSQPPAAPA